MKGKSCSPNYQRFSPCSARVVPWPTAPNQATRPRLLARLLGCFWPSPGSPPPSATASPSTPTRFKPLAPWARALPSCGSMAGTSRQIRQSACRLLRLPALLIPALLSSCALPEPCRLRPDLEKIESINPLETANLRRHLSPADYFGPAVRLKCHF